MSVRCKFCHQMVEPIDRHNCLRYPLQVRIEELEAENERLRELLYRWMSTQEDSENVTPELLEETDKAIDAAMEGE